MGKRGRLGNVIFGLILIGLGAWFLLGSIGFDLPNIGDLWPIFPTLGGLAFIASYLFGGEEDPGVLVPGVGGLLVGLLFFAITVGPLRWGDLGELWPLFPLIGGVAFLVTWLFGRDPGLLVPAGMGLLVGLGGLFFTLSEVDLAVVARWWPVLLILVGLGLMVQTLVGR